MRKKPLKIIAGTPDRPLVIGDIEIPCLCTGRRNASAESKRVSSSPCTVPNTKAGTGGLSTVDELPFFLRAEQLKPFISKELRMSTTPILFCRNSSQKIVVGYNALLLPQVCEVYLQARDVGALLDSQQHIADRAAILIRGLAAVGIIALVDEATGYQRLREERALATILEKVIAKELQPWTKTFPYEFYTEICRLKKWPIPDGVKRPSVIGHYTNNIVYKRIAPGVLNTEKKPGQADHEIGITNGFSLGPPKTSGIAGVNASFRRLESALTNQISLAL